jgi:hemolysin-activating ACP:hemolysin acyltransferase
MSKSYSWKIADQDDFHAIYTLIYNSKFRTAWGVDDVRRRIIIPLFLAQLITFYDKDEKLCGFVTLAFMDTVSADHQATVGILPNDWRSGPHLWVVDLFANDGGGAQMLRALMRDMDRTAYKSVRYFRLKYRKLAEVRV